MKAPQLKESPELKAARENIEKAMSTPEGRESLQRVAEQISQDPYSWANQYK
jgi:hypothetical protein